MPSVNKIQTKQTRKKYILTPKNTGYAAAGAILLSTTRAFSKSQPIKKTHKFLGYLSAILTLLHIGVVEYLHYKYKKM